ncbi:Cluap1 [Symbiodinium pilosum]|uniref:Cluap1 protein n=1 Tax=Symbiodinium pilosum TaxID=2952 RepID=A0A812SV44_SYMPI|nr:Cluap1 [Symbiodinium pilosum]
MAMLLSRALRSGHLTSYSAVGNFSHFSLRQRYTQMLKAQTDPTLADFFFESYLRAFFADPPSYNYWFISIAAFGACIGILSRQIFFNPDVMFRYQEKRKPLPDRHRQWTYSLPFFNHRLRNMCCKYKACLIDNEPDWADYHPLGYRPNRKQSNRRPYMWILTIPRYTMEDPLYTSVTHENMNRIYEEVGYTKPAKTEEE